MPSTPQDLPTITHLTDPESFDGQTLEIQGQAYQHLFRSRRLATGDSIRIVNGEGSARRGLVSEIDRKRATVELGDPLPSHETDRRLHLKVGALRPERADWLVEKATELGVFSVTFIATERTPRHYGQGRLERLQRVASAAVEQSRRSRCPHLEGVMAWQDLMQSLDPKSSFALHPGGRAIGLLKADSDAQDVTILIGPEGGFSDREIAELRSCGIAALGLGSSILRVETAALAACALWLLD